MIRMRTSVAALLLLHLTASFSFAAANLIRNGGFESATPGKLPPGWEPLSIGTEAKFTADAQERRDGAASICIDAAEVTRSYIRSTDPIPVAAGETIEASAWVKIQNVPPGQGTVIAIAEFADADAKQLAVAKFNTADVGQTTWQQVKGAVEVPPGAASLRLRLGFSYSHGACWWDDVTVMARQPLVCRIDPAVGSRLSPAMKTLPVQVLNRDSRKSRVTVRVNKQQVEVQLTGKPIQHVEVPVTVGKPGKSNIELALLEADRPEPAYSQSHPMTTPPPLAVSPPSPTHWVVDDGPAVVEAVVNLAVPEELRNRCSLVARIVDANDETRASSKLGPTKDGLNPFMLKLGKLPVGEYKLVVELQPSRGQPIHVGRAQQPWRVIRRNQAKVTINDLGFPVYDGKAIYPLGIFNGGRFKEQADAGFSVTHAYNAARILPDPFTADQKAFDYIENSHEHGMKLLFMIPIKEAIEGDFETVRRRVRMFRNHPGLLAWDEEEGFARGDFKPDTLKKIRRIIDEEDPHHPLMVGDSADVIGRSRGRPDFFPDAEMDLGMWWWYPFPLKPRPGDALEGEDGNQLAGRWDVLTPPAFFTNARTNKPLWIGIQSYKKRASDPDSRYPTPSEYRTQAYLALASGAKGLMWYGGSVTGGLFLNPDEGHWPELQKLVREIRDREAFWLAATTEKPSITPADAPIAAVIKRTPDGRSLLLAVNRGPDELDATLAGQRHRFQPYGVLVREQVK